MKTQRILLSVAAPFAHAVSKLSEKKRKYIAVVSMFFVFCLFFFTLTKLAPYRYPFFASCFLLAVITIIYLQTPLYAIRWKKSCVFLWAAMCVFMLQAAFRLSSDYFAEALMLTIILPLWFLFWNNREDASLFRVLSWGCIISFILVIVVDIFLFPAGSGIRVYNGFLLSAMGAGEYYAVVFPCLLIEVFRLRSLREKRSLLIVLIGICVALCFYSGSRAGQVAIIVSFLCTSVLYLINHRNEWKKRVLMNILPVLLSIIICIPCALYLFQARTIVADMFPKPSTVEPAVTPGITPGVTPEITPEVTPGTEQTDENSQKPNVNFILERNWNRFFSPSKTQSLDRFSSGRLSIWKGYLQHLNLLGHDFHQRFEVDHNVTFTTAHMTHLEYAYRYGIPCALLFLAYNIIAGIGAIRYALRSGKEEDYMLLPIAVTLCYGAVSVCISLSFGVGHVLSLYYGLIQTPLILSHRLSEQKFAPVSKKQSEIL